MADGNRLDLKQLAGRVIELLEPELAKDGFDLLDVRVFRGGGRHQLRIYVDTQGGKIALDQVTSASRTAGMLLEEADLIPGQYVIEVSSPGVRRPLRTPVHFSEAVGQKVDLKVAGGEKRRVRGLLTAVESGTLAVTTDTDDGEKETVKVPLKAVIEGNLDPDFDAQALINADRRQRREEKRKKRRAGRGKKKSRPRAPRGETPPTDGDAE